MEILCLLASFPCWWLSPRTPSPLSTCVWTRLTAILLPQNIILFLKREHIFQNKTFEKKLTNEFFEKSFTFSLKNLCEKERCEATGKLDKPKQDQDQGFSSCQVHDGGKYHKGQILFRLFKHLKKILKFTTYIIKESWNFIGLIPSQAHIYTISLCNNPNPTFKPF